MKRLAIIKVIIAAVLLVFSVNAMGQPWLKKVIQVSTKAVSATPQITSHLAKQAASGAALNTSYAAVLASKNLSTTQTSLQTDHINLPTFTHQRGIYKRTQDDILLMDEFIKEITPTRQYVLPSTTTEQPHIGTIDINSPTEEIDRGNSIEDNVNITEQDDIKSAQWWNNIIKLIPNIVDELPRLEQEQNHQSYNLNKHNQEYEYTYAA